MRYREKLKEALVKGYASENLVDSKIRKAILKYFDKIKKNGKKIAKGTFLKNFMSEEDDRGDVQETSPGAARSLKADSMSNRRGGATITNDRLTLSQSESTDSQVSSTDEGDIGRSDSLESVSESKMELEAPSLTANFLKDDDDDDDDDGEELDDEKSRESGSFFSDFDAKYNDDDDDEDDEDDEDDSRSRYNRRRKPKEGEIDDDIRRLMTRYWGYGDRPWQEKTHGPKFKHDLRHLEPNPEVQETGVLEGPIALMKTSLKEDENLWSRLKAVHGAQDKISLAMLKVSQTINNDIPYMPHTKTPEYEDPFWKSRDALGQKLALEKVFKDIHCFVLCTTTYIYNRKCYHHLSARAHTQREYNI